MTSLYWNVPWSHINAHIGLFIFQYKTYASPFDQYGRDSVGMEYFSKINISMQTMESLFMKNSGSFVFQILMAINCILIFGILHSVFHIQGPIKTPGSLCFALRKMCGDRWLARGFEMTNSSAGCTGNKSCIVMLSRDIWVFSSKWNKVYLTIRQSVKRPTLSFQYNDYVHCITHRKLRFSA